MNKLAHVSVLLLVVLGFGGTVQAQVLDLTQISTQAEPCFVESCSWLSDAAISAMAEAQVDVTSITFTWNANGGVEASILTRDGEALEQFTGSRPTVVVARANAAGEPEAEYFLATVPVDLPRGVQMFGGAVPMATEMETTQSGDDEA
ncbi:MAG: hypothetical protein AAFX99_34825, partial [Myxococcota bacterium]